MLSAHPRHDCRWNDSPRGRHNSHMHSLADAFHRLWQPRRSLFWLILALQLLSSGIVLFMQITDPPDGLRLVLSLMALTDSLLACWLTVRLWRESAPVPNPQETPPCSTPS
jgi:hypothetical protein